MDSDYHSPIASFAGQDGSRLGAFLESRFRQRYEVEAVAHVIAFVDESSTGFDQPPNVSNETYIPNLNLWNQDYSEYLDVRNDTCIIVMGAHASRLWVGQALSARPQPNSLYPANRVGVQDAREVVVQEHLFLPHFESTVGGSILSTVNGFDNNRNPIEVETAVGGHTLSMDRIYSNPWGPLGWFAQVAFSGEAVFKTSPLLSIRAPVFFYRDNSGSFKTEHSELMASQLRQHFGEDNYFEHIDTSERWLKPCNDFLRTLFGQG